MKKEVNDLAAGTATPSVVVSTKSSDRTMIDTSGPIETQALDLCLIMDCTGSMEQWIERAQHTLTQIIDSVRAENEGLTVRVAFVGYRDFTEGEKRFSLMDFTEDINVMKTFIKDQQAFGGVDWAEDVQGGLNQALRLNWNRGSVKNAFLITDAPGHGRDICDWGDDYPDGSPEGFKIQDQMREFAGREINFSMVKVNERCNQMIKVMQDSFGASMNVSDLAQACSTQTKEQVNQKFIKSASFILSATLAGRKDSKAKIPLWDIKQFEKDQYFSQTAYLHVQQIEGNNVTVSN